MKRFYSNLSLLTLALFGIVITSCKSDGELKIESVPYQSKENGEWGMVSTEGNEIAEDEYKSVPTVASEGRYWVKNSKGYWELYDTDEGKTVVDDEFRYVSLFRNGRAIVAKRDENVTVIDRKGEQVADLSKVGQYTPDQFSGFNGDLAVFSVNEKVGVCTYKGEVVVKPVYSVINEPYCGKIVATDSVAFNSMMAMDSVAKPSGNVVVFNYKGEEILKLPRKKYAMTGDRFYGDYIAVAKERGEGEDGMMNWGIVNIKGEEVLKPSKKYSMIGEISGNMFSYYDGENWGVSTIEGEKVLPAKFVSITFSGDYIIAGSSESGSEEVYDVEDLETRLYDKKGEAVISKKYMQMYVLGKHIFAQVESDRWDILDMKGERVDGAPKICNINVWNTGDYFISTDKIDISKFVKDLDFTADTMDGLTFSSSVQQALKRQAEYYTLSNTPKAADYNYTDEVSIYRRIDGCGVTETVKYPTKLSHQNYREQQVIDFWVGYTYYYHINKIPTGFTFTTAKPQSFSMTFDNYGILRGKLKTLYKELCERFSKMGTETEHSQSATVYSLAGGRYAIVYLEPHSVTAKWGSLPLSERNVYQYAGNKEDLSVEDDEIMDIGV